MVATRALPRLAAAAACTVIAASSPALGAPPRQRPTGPGEVTVTSLTNGATIEIDGKVVGTVPLDESLVVLAGKHEIKVTKRGCKPYVDTFEIAGGDTLELEIDLIPFAGIIKVTTPEPGATVKVDDQIEGVTPLDKDIPAGKRLFTVSMEGFLDEVREENVVAGAEANLHFVLKPMPVEVARSKDSGAFYEQWWFWTIVGVAGAGAVAAVAVTSGGETITPTPSFTLTIP